MRRALALLPLLVVLAACSSPTTSDDDVTALAVGDCFDLVETAEVTSVPTIDCAEEHDLEVYAIVTMDGDDFPGADAVLTETADRCGDEFEGFLGIAYTAALARGEYDFTSLYPTEESWKLGDREIVCAIAATTPDGLVSRVTGSLKGAETP